MRRTGSGAEVGGHYPPTGSQRLGPLRLAGRQAVQSESPGTLAAGAADSVGSCAQSVCDSATWSQGADTPVPAPAPAPDLPGDGDARDLRPRFVRGQGRSPVPVPDLSGESGIGDAPPSPSPIQMLKSGTRPLECCESPTGVEVLPRGLVP